MRRTLLGIDLKTGEKIVLNDKERRAGMYVLGVQGRGKSSLLLDLISQDLEKGYSVIVFDAHDDLIRHLVALLPPERLHHTYLLDLDDVDYPYGLNIFACTDPHNELERAIVVERVLHIFERLWPELRGILLEKLLRYLTLTFLECPGYSLIDVRRFLWDDDFRGDLVRRLTNEEVKAYWQHEYDAMTRSERRTETQALENRLAAFLSTPFVRNIVSQRQSTLDVYRSIQEQEVLLIRLPMAGRQAHVPLIGTLLLAQIHAATFAFAKVPWNERPGFSLYVDEFQHFATADFAELYKEARKFGARITVAHQDRHDLAPENRSATLTASTIISFQPTPADAAELAPLFFDPQERLRPRQIYADTLRHLRLHEHPDLQDFYRRYVLPLQQKKQAQQVLEVLQDLLYQSVQTQRVDERLFASYTQQMFPLLHLMFEESQRKRRRLQVVLREQQRDIDALNTALTSGQAFEDYLVMYYWHYINYGYRHVLEWYFQPWVPEGIMLADTEFWDKVLGKTQPYLSTLGYTRQERLKKALQALQEEATENGNLHQRDTFEKVVAEVTEEIDVKRSYALGQLWGTLAEVHKLKSEYAVYPSVQQFHADQYQHRHSITTGPGNDLLFWQPVRSRKKQGRIDERTRIDDLVAEALPLEAESSRAQVLAWLQDSGRWSGDPLRERVLAAWDRARRSYAELRRLDGLLADQTALLKDYYARVGMYARNQGLWEHLNNDQVDANVWRALDRELQRNKFLGQLRSVEQLVHQRKDALRKKIALMREEAAVYQASMPALERNIEEEVSAIAQQRDGFCTYVRRVLETLIDDPGPLGERRIPTEKDTVEKLLDLQKRQALVRIAGDVNHQARKYTMNTLDVPQAAKPDEVERRSHQIQAQTRLKYGRPRDEVEVALRSPARSAGREGEPDGGDEDHGAWYEE